MFERMETDSNGFLLAGWEPARMARIRELFKLYEDVDERRLFANLVYFLKAVMPACDANNVNMAIHIDDPARSVFGLPCVVKGKADLLRLMNAVPNPHNGVTLCTGSLGSNPDNDIPDIIRALVEIGFDGPIRPDHGRAIWGEVSMPGYGLYDRALGSQYLLGIHDAITHARG